MHKLILSENASQNESCRTRKKDAVNSSRDTLCASSSLLRLSFFLAAALIHTEMFFVSNCFWWGEGKVRVPWLDYWFLGHSQHQCNRDMNKTPSLLWVPPRFLRWNFYHWQLPETHPRRRAQWEWKLVINTQSVLEGWSHNPTSSMYTYSRPSHDCNLAQAWYYVDTKIMHCFNSSGLGGALQKFNTFRFDLT